MRSAKSRPAGRRRARRRNPERLSGTVLAGMIAASVESTQSFSIWAPDAYTMRREAASGLLAENVAHLRAAYVPSSATALLIAGAISYGVRSWLPLLIAGGTSLLMVFTYERALPPDVRLDPFRALLAAALPTAPPARIIDGTSSVRVLEAPR